MLKNFSFFNNKIKIKEEINRKKFIQNLAVCTGSFVLLPVVSSCKWFEDQKLSIPKVINSNWNPIQFNRERGNQGAIPASYLPSINGIDGEKKHIGKHLPFVPEIEPEKIPDGFLPIMWGDPSKGYAKHPNAPKNNTKGYEGHWYNWIRIRKATSGNASELKSTYSNWPSIGSSDNGSYVAFGDQEITSNSGKNTIYLAALPPDVKKGDTLRIYAHCKTHGEWVDFVKI